MGAKLNVVISLKDKLSKAVKKSDAAIAHFTNRIRRSGRELLSYQNVLKAVIAYQFIRLGKSVIGAASKIEVFGKQLEMVSENATVAAKTLDVMRDFARNSPLETEDVIRSYVRLRAVGINPTMKQMKTMGGVAVMMNRELTDVVGALISRHARTLREYGIELNAQGKNAIVQSGKIRKEVDKDNTSIRKAVLETWEERFPNAITRAAGTFTAQMAIMRSGMFEFFAKLGKLFLPELKNLVKWIDTKFRELEEKIEKNKEGITRSIKKIAEEVENLYKTLKPYVQLLLKHWDIIIWSGAAVVIAGVIVKIAALTTAFYGLAVAIASNPIGLLAVVGVGAIAAFATWENKVQSTIRKLKGYGDEISITNKKLEYLNELQELYGQQAFYQWDLRGKEEKKRIEALKTIEYLETNLAVLGVSFTGGMEARYNAASKLINKLKSLGRGLPPTTPSKETTGLGLPLKKDETDKTKTTKKTDYVALVRQADVMKANVMKEGVAKRVALARQEGIEKLATMEKLEAQLHHTVFVPWAQMKYDLAKRTEEKITEIEKEGVKERFAKAVETMDLFVGKTNEITNLVVDNMRVRREATFEKEEKEINAMRISDRAKQKLLDKAEKKNQERAKKEKAMAIAMSFINSGASIIKLWANPGYPLAIPLTIMVGILHSLQIAKMKAQKFASGIFSAPGGYSMVGERGPESMYVPPGARITNAAQTRNTMNSPISFNVTINGAADEHTVGQLKDTLYQFKENLVDSIRYGYLNKTDFAGVM